MINQLENDTNSITLLLKTVINQKSGKQVKHK